MRVPILFTPSELRQVDFLARESGLSRNATIVKAVEETLRELAQANAET